MTGDAMNMHEAKELGLRAVRVCSRLRKNAMPDGALVTCDGHNRHRITGDPRNLRVWIALQIRLSRSDMIDVGAWPDYRDELTAGCLLPLLQDVWEGGIITLKFTLEGVSILMLEPYCSLGAHAFNGNEKTLVEVCLGALEFVAERRIEEGK